MNSVYLYISRSKVNSLYRSAKRGQSIKGLGLKLKGPFVEADASIEFDTDLYRMLKYVRKHLDNSKEVSPFHTLGSSSVPVVSFFGSAAIVVYAETLCLALAEGATALLLAGSAGNMVGAQHLPSTSTRTFLSASINPIGALKAAFEGASESQSLSKDLSFSWQALRRDAGVGSAVLRNVQGLAIFVGSYPANKAQIRRAGAINVTNIVVASPIYVEQV